MLVVLTAFLTFMITAFSMYSYYNESSAISLFNTTSKRDGNVTSDIDLEKYLKRIKATINKYYL